MSLSKLRITGSKKGYQWVSFGEKKALYPLTGRGHPYGIKMRDVPDTGLLQQGLEGSISGSALQEALLEGPEEIQEQFILKPRHSATNQAWKQQGKDKKTVNKSSVKNSAFWCSSRTREDNQDPPLPPRKQKQLFGAPLEAVCDNDTLPTPILEMLSFINQKGPFTEGIFRKPASIKSAIALKEKLNAGHKVNFDDEPILVVSSVLKDFLRNIQGSIFSARLYDKWLDVIDEGNEEEKITATQRLVDQLPKANVVLLRYLFGVLHNIEQHSSSNQMTPYNLSVCLAPSILCLLNSGSSAFEKGNKKVSLIQFLIENCLKIFGEDITSLFGENSVSCDNSDITDNSEISGTTEQSLESKPVRVTMIYEKVQLQYDAMTSSRMGPPTDLSTVF
uniref:Uncharacterized protein n=1 Tax=Ovis aries TaxID=9940 RepID=A0AC11EKV0_SHEEP